MKQLPILITAACALVLCTTTRAQTPAAPVAAAVGADPALAALTAKYEADVATLKKTQEAALIALRAPYLTALSGAEQKATLIGDAAVLKALLEEKQTVNAGGVLLVTPPAALPHNLNTARTTYIREVTRIGQTLPPREKALESAYIRDLGALEQRAQLTKNMALVTQIGQEKLRLIGVGKAPTSPTVTSKTDEPHKAENVKVSASGTGLVAKGKNVTVNGDFTRAYADGTPFSWGASQYIVSSVLKDAGNPYCHIELLAKKERLYALAQGFDVDDSFKKVSVTARLRCGNLKVNDLNNDPKVGMMVDRVSKSKDTGIDAVQSSVASIWFKENKPNWKSYTISADVKPGNTKVYVWFIFDGLTGELDVDDVEVEFH